MAATDFLYMRPDELTSLYGTITLTAGTMDSDYTAASLANGNTSKPVRTTSGTATFRNTFAAAGEVGMIVVANHNLDAAKVITVSNGLSTTVTCNTPTPPNGIPLNPFAIVTPVAGVTALDFAISGNSQDIVIGEILAGKYRTLPRFVYTDDDIEEDDYARKVDVDLSSVLPYDPGMKSRTWKGSIVVTSAQLALIIAWHEAQRGGTRPSVIVPISTVNDAWVVTMLPPRYKPAGGIYWRVDLSFIEYPRPRW